MSCLRWLLALALLLTVAHSQNYYNACSLFCASCPPLNNYFTCKTCPTDFITTNLSPSLGQPNCTVNTTIYSKVYDLAVGDLSLNTSNTANLCSGYQSKSGIFDPNTEVNFWSAADDVGPHYYLRIMVSILFVDRWQTGSGSNGINFLEGTSTIGFRAADGQGTNTQYEKCRSNNYNSRERHAKLTIAYLHTATNFNLSMKATSCADTSSCGWIVVDLLMMLKMCHEYCTVCNGITKNTCSACVSGYWLTNTTCDDNCFDNYFQTATPGICQKCNNSCFTCVADPNNCTVCKPGFIYHYVNTSCLTVCPSKFYNFTDPSTGINSCADCDTTCALCTNNPSPCQACIPTYYLYMAECSSNCPVGFVKDDNAHKCQNCSTYCIRMNLTQYVPDGGQGLSPLMFDLNFSFPLDWSTIDMPTFQSISFGGNLYSLSSFNVSYVNTSTRSYRITFNVPGYAFVINQSVTIKVIVRPNPDPFKGSDGRPFIDDVFNQTLKVSWTYVKPPNMGSTEVGVVQAFSSLSSSMNTALTAPGVQELKKFGFLLLVLNSLQITSCLMLVNTILPQNLYEGIRFFASLIFFDVPPWEEESLNSKYLVSVPISSLPTRRMLAINLDEFRFRRTGFSGVFIFDAYSQIFIIIVSYILLGLVVLISRCWAKVKRLRPFFESTMDAFHEIAVMYFTLSIVFEFTYFDFSAIKWASIVACFVVNLYYFLYQLKVYYALLEFPSIPINSQKFEEFVIKYSFYLKNIRFDNQNLEAGKCAIIKLWFRPHNYHILSYTKKFLMMLTFPLFFNYVYAQVIVLIVIQGLEIIRFIFTWPYASKWRNVARLFLESVLEGVFVLVLFIELIIVYLTESKTTNSVYASLFFAVGWIAFALIYIYNIGFLLLFCVNWFQNCNYSNRQILEKSRKNYYFNLLREHEENNEEVPLNLLNDWVKKGNLNNHIAKELPEITYRIEYYRICKVDDEYLMEMKTVMDLSMDTQFNFRFNDNNLQPLQILEKNFILNPISEIFRTFRAVYERWSSEGTQSVVIKTFIDVDQSKFKFEETIPMKFQKMHQEVEVHNSTESMPRVHKQKGLMPNFPIPYDLLLKGARMAERSVSEWPL